MLLLLATALNTASAQDTVEDYRIYQENPALTKGNLASFREIYVDPEAFPGQIKPTEPGEGTGVLLISNATSAPTIIRINDQKVGMVGPTETARIHGVAAGTYTVSLKSDLNHMEWTARIATIGEDQVQAALRVANPTAFQINRPSTLLAVPLPPVGKVVVQDATVLPDVAKAAPAAIKACYDPELRKAPELAGVVTVTVAMKRGKVTGVTSDNQTGSAALGSCVQAAAESWAYPSDGNGSYTLAFDLTPVAQ